MGQIKAFIFCLFLFTTLCIPENQATLNLLGLKGGEGEGENCEECSKSDETNGGGEEYFKGLGGGEGGSDGGGIFGDSQFEPKSGSGEKKDWESNEPEENEIKKINEMCREHQENEGFIFGTSLFSYILNFFASFSAEFSYVVEFYEEDFYNFFYFCYGYKEEFTVESWSAFMYCMKEYGFCGNFKEEIYSCFKQRCESKADSRELSNSQSQFSYISMCEYFSQLTFSKFCEKKSQQRVNEYCGRWGIPCKKWKKYTFGFRYRVRFYYYLKFTHYYSKEFKFGFHFKYCTNKYLSKGGYEKMYECFHKRTKSYKKPKYCKDIKCIRKKYPEFHNKYRAFCEKYGDYSEDSQSIMGSFIFKSKFYYYGFQFMAYFRYCEERTRNKKCYKAYKNCMEKHWLNNECTDGEIYNCFDKGCDKDGSNDGEFEDDDSKGGKGRANKEDSGYDESDKSGNDQSEGDRGFNKDKSGSEEKEEDDDRKSDSGKTENGDESSKSDEAENSDETGGSGELNKEKDDDEDDDKTDSSGYNENKHRSKKSSESDESSDNGPKPEKKNIKKINKMCREHRKSNDFIFGTSLFSYILNFFTSCSKEFSYVVEFYAKDFYKFFYFCYEYKGEFTVESWSAFMYCMKEYGFCGNFKKEIYSCFKQRCDSKAEFTQISESQSQFSYSLMSKYFSELTFSKFCEQKSQQRVNEYCGRWGIPCKKWKKYTFGFRYRVRFYYYLKFTHYYSKEFKFGFHFKYCTNKYLSKGRYEKMYECFHERTKSYKKPKYCRDMKCIRKKYPEFHNKYRGFCKKYGNYSKDSQSIMGSFIFKSKSYYYGFQFMAYFRYCEERTKSKDCYKTYKSCLEKHWLKNKCTDTEIYDCFDKGCSSKKNKKKKVKKALKNDDADY